MTAIVSAPVGHPLSNLFFFSASNDWTWWPEFSMLVPVALAVGVFFALVLASRIAVRAWQLTWLEFSGWVQFGLGLVVAFGCHFFIRLSTADRQAYSLESILLSILGLLMVIAARLRN
jgi:hypothetical protein